MIFTSDLQPAQVAISERCQSSFAQRRSRSMPRNLERSPKLASLGFSFLCDLTGRLFKSRKVNLKDLNGNVEALLRDLIL